MGTLFLALLAAGVGPASADPVVVTDAVEYDGTVEIVFDEPVSDVRVNAARVGGQPDESLVSDVTVDPDDARRATVSLNRDVPTGVELSLDVRYTSVNGTEATESLYPKTTTTTLRATAEVASKQVLQGETVAFVTNGTRQSVSFGSITGYSGSNSTVYLYPTGNLENETYDIQFEDGKTTEMDVEALDLDVRGSQYLIEDENLVVEVRSNRNHGRFIGTLHRADGEEVRSRSGSYQSNRWTSVNFGTVSPGDYELVIQDRATGTEIATNFTVYSDMEPGVGFSGGKDVNYVDVGGVAYLPVAFSDDTSNATMTFGSQDDGYYAFANLTDGDRDGKVTVAFNTYAAGSAASTETVSAVDPDDNATLVEEGGNFAERYGDKPPDAALLSSGPYNLNITAGQYEMDDNLVERDEVAVGTLVVEPRRANSISVWRTPNGTNGNSLTGTELRDGAHRNITDASHVTREDKLVIAVNATGLNGTLARHDNLSGAAALVSNDTVESTSLTVERAGSDTGGERFVLDANETRLARDQRNATFYVITPVAGIGDGSTELANGEPYRARFSITNDSGDSVVSTVTSDEFRVVPATARIGTRGDATLALASGESQTISGPASFAPGTQLTLVLDARSDDYTRRIEGTVRRNGTFAATADLSELEGNRFTASLRYQNETLDTVSGHVGDVTTPENSSGATTPETGSQPTTTTGGANSSEVTSATDRRASQTAVTPGTGPGFGFLAVPVALALVTLVGHRRGRFGS